MQRSQIVLSEYAGDSVQIAFEYLDGDQWNYGYCIDNVALGSIPAVEAELKSVASSCTDAVAGMQLELSGAFSNEGSETITSLDINWSDGVETYSETISDLEIATFESYVFSHPTLFTVPEGSASIDIWISNPNGVEDTMDNNRSSVTVRGVTPKVGQMIVVEEATGTWCPWCPRGAVFLDRYTKCFPDNFVGIAIHNEDPMVNAAYDSWVADYPGFEGYPSVIVDREGAPIDPADIGNPTVSKITTDPTVTVEGGITWDETSRTMGVGIEASLTEDLSNARLNVVIVENGVTGTSTDYNQANNYAGGSFGPMGGYENLPASVPASMMIYDHVARYIPSGPEGQEDATVTGVSGDKIGYLFPEVVVDEAFNVENMEIIGLIHDASGSIINAIKLSFDEALANGLPSTTTNTEEVFSSALASISPNPARDISYVTMDLRESSTVAMTIVDATGKIVLKKDFGLQQGNVTLELDVASLTTGLYLVHLNAGDTLITKKLSVQK